MKTALIHSEEWARFDYGPEHPLRMERLTLTWRLMQAYGLTTLPQARLVAPEPAEESALLKFHVREYLEILKAADCGTAPAAAAARYGLGPGDNPTFAGLWEAARLAAGGSLCAARLVASGEVTRAFHFAGGLHHAMRDRASGFCYVNDAVLAILHLRAAGLRVLYVDIDAHHGDGVQWAFYRDPNVLTISLHERGDRLFPGTGFVEEVGEGEGAGYSVNVPLDMLTDSTVYLPAFEAVVPPLARAFAPDVIVAQLGIDSHRTDPLTHLALDIQGFGCAVTRIAEMAPRLVALGGGGYDLENVARAWTLAWALMNGVELPAELPAAFHEMARGYRFRCSSLWDPPHEMDPDRRGRAREYAERQVDAIRRVIFPAHRL
ncbi:MAG: acetoin utilization protein AcuC [Candidatus Rokubacteria bacterium]|nr:acetoin utilization protein AcuC [Candidatus Rokubacteria bacterium]MBI3825124.1 acetoin utilization protein AcuC [Candidatus Rokubacteria bacterium]